MFKLKRWASDERIAYIELDGVIVESKTVSGESAVIDLLGKVEKEKLKALVLRINSPGGTVGASQEIYAALRRLSEKQGIKIVASMGDVAASGGVYVAMGADYIFAQPGTVTGSIGVIIKSGNVGKLLDKIGIGSNTVKSGRYKDILSMEKPLSDEERTLLQTTTDDTHTQFIEVVARRRGLSLDAVQAFADGRIFTGRQALQYQLVDELGGMREALEKARELAGLPMKGLPQVYKLKRKKTFMQKILNRSLLGNLGPVSSLFQETLAPGIPLWLMTTYSEI